MKRFDGKVFVEIQINFIMATLFGADECSIWTDCLLDLVFINNFFTSFAVIRAFKVEIAQQNVETGSTLDNKPSLCGI